MIKMEKFDFVFILTSIPDETCGYCGVKKPGCYLEHISVVRNGKSRELWRCEKCRQDMKTFKPSD
jgi:hypothetical protein